jgi:hypothetical protein
MVLVLYCSSWILMGDFFGDNDCEETALLKFGDERDPVRLVGLRC